MTTAINDESRSKFLDRLYLFLLSMFSIPFFIHWLADNERFESNLTICLVDPLLPDCPCAHQGNGERFMQILLHA